MLKRLKCCLLAATLMLTAAPLSAAALLSDADAENGVWAEYYKGKFSSYSSGRFEDKIDNVWTTSNLPNGLTSRENFSVRYSFRLLTEAAGTYEIYCEADDGVQVSLNDIKLISDDGPHYPNESEKSISLNEKTYYDIVIEYYNGELDGTCKLYWKVPGKDKQIIPEDNIFKPLPARAEIKKSSGKIYACGSALTDSGEIFSVVLEKYDSNGALAQTVKSSRASKDTFIWETEKMTYDNNCDYKAFVTSCDSESVSETDELLSGVNATLTVDTYNTSPDSISPLMYGACLEDVNHELYGGIWSQLIFGDSFAEPANAEIPGFASAGGSFSTSRDDGVNQVTVSNQANGPKLIINDTEMTSGEISADIKMSGEGPAGFIIKTTDAKEGADNFNGYEIGIANNMLRIGKHEYNYSNIGDYSCSAPENTWVSLKVVMTENSFDVYVNQTLAASYTDPNPLKTGSIGLRAWSCDASFKNITVINDDGEQQNIQIAYPIATSVSQMWSPVVRGEANGEFSIVTESPYKGTQSQNITFTSGSGAVGISNSSLNKKGINFEKDKEYEGYIYARSAAPTTIYAVAESADGGNIYAETEISISSDEWTKYEFKLTPNAKDSAGKITFELRSSASVDLGYVFFQPGEWGRFEGLPVRKDAAELLKEQGVTVLRFGGCMANATDYKWKSMLGDPETRPTYKGWWYDYSSFGFGIIEFMNLCEKLGVVGIPDFNGYETAEDMADFIDFALGTDPDNEWVQKRIEMGHEEPYSLPYLQYGNEEGAYGQSFKEFTERFNAAANAIWEKTDDITLILGDFAYQQVITDPYNFDGADNGLRTLEYHKSVLDNAAAHNMPVWFDIHIWNEKTTDPDRYFDAAMSLYTQLKKLSPDADFKLPVFELNANTHDMERALSNAYSIIRAEQLSNIFPVVISANCLQVDGHNDNGWNQGLIFMNNDSAWMQPPAYVTQMSQEVYQSTKLEYSSKKLSDSVSVVASRSADGKTIILKTANLLSTSYTIKIQTPGFSGNQNTVSVTALKASSNSAVNTADNPYNVVPINTVTENALVNNQLNITLSPRSYTTIQITAESEHISPSSVTLSASSTEISVSEQFTLTAEVSDNTAHDAEIGWISSDNSVANVSNGVVTGVKAGSVVITAYLKNYPDITASCTVSVKAQSISDDNPAVNPPTVTTPQNGTVTVNGKTVLYVNGKAVTGTKVVTVSGKMYAVVGGYVKTGKKQVVKIKSLYYIVNASGVVQKGTKNKLIKVGTKSYVVNKNGVVQRKASGKKLVKVGTKSYIVNKLGVVQKGTKNKLVKIGKKAYIVNKSGVVQKNKKSIKVGKKTYKTNKKGVAVKIK